MTRIRYKKNNDGTLISPTITVGNEPIQIELRLMNLSYVIHSASRPNLTGNATNLSALKRKAKQAAIGLGATFGAETRLPRSGKPS